MKMCLLCGCVDDGGDAATCPNDGEATWMAVEQMVATEVSPPEPAVEDAPKKRGRK